MLKALTRVLACQVLVSGVVPKQTINLNNDVCPKSTPTDWFGLDDNICKSTPEPFYHSAKAYDGSPFSESPEALNEPSAEKLPYFAEKETKAEVNNFFAPHLTKLIDQANKGNVKSQIRLGYMYQKGLEDTPQDLEKAIVYYTLAVKQDDAKYSGKAAYLLGNIYRHHAEGEKGFFIKEITKQRAWVRAFNLYKKAAELGDPDGTNNLSMAYEYGLGTQRNHVLARKWLLKAVEYNDEAALFRLASRFQKGHWGFRKDTVTALILFKKSYEQGAPEALERFNILLDKTKIENPGEYDEFHDVAKRIENPGEYDKLIAKIMSEIPKDEL